MEIRIEEMSAAFTKFHIQGPWPFHPVFHRFTAPDRGDPHDHPWDFRSVVMRGGYIEEVFDIKTGESEIRHRNPGDSFFVSADHIHRIVELKLDECWTMILPGLPSGKDSRFYQFRSDGVWSRPWHRAEFRPHGDDET